MIKAIISATISNIILMVPVALLYYLVRDYMAGNFGDKVIFYVAGCLITFVLIGISTYVQYNATFLSTYVESGVRRVTLAEKLRTYQPQPDPMEQQAKELELAKLQAEVQKLQAEVQKIQAEAGLQGAKAQIESVNAQTSAYKTQADMDKAAAEADLKRAQADNERLAYELNANGISHLQDMEKMRAQAQGNQNLAITKALLKSRKPDETRPDVEAAIGYNAISEDIANYNRL